MTDRCTVTKGPEKLTVCRRSFARFERGRNALAAFLGSVVRAGQQHVLLPSYVGWSPRDGSGVSDPVLTMKLTPVFYRVDRQLRIDFADLCRKLDLEGIGVLVLIHYFGRPDPKAARAVAEARSRRIPVLEDEAHAMLTDMVLGTCGRRGHAALFSLPKLLPVPGGVIAWNGIRDDGSASGDDRALDAVKCTGFDLHAIAARRLANWAFLIARVRQLRKAVRPLWPAAAPTFVPHSFPVVVRYADRDALYEWMNRRGFGVTSLYHSLIPEIGRADYPDSYWLSERILNLPLHQDVDSRQLGSLVDAFGRGLQEVPRKHVSQGSGSIKRF